MRPATVEVRFEDLSVEADVLVGSAALPSVPHALLQTAQVRLALGNGCSITVGAITFRKTHLTMLAACLGEYSQ